MANIVHFRNAAGQPAAAGDPISLSQAETALNNLDGDASTTNVTPVYPGGAAASHPRTLSDIFGQVIRAKDYGAKGDNITDDWQALTNAINAINAIESSSSPFPVCLLFEGGFYKYTQALPPITVPCRVLSTDPRGAELVPIGSFDGLQFFGSGTGALSSYAGTRGIAMNCTGQTGPCSAIYADTASDFTVLDTLIFGSVNGITYRQCSNTIFEKIELTGYTGYGFKSFGGGGSRNGGTDLNNVVTIRDVAACGSADGSRVTNNADSFWFDGAVQTVRVFGTSAVNAGRALRVTNTPGVANPYFMQFFYAFDFEGENHGSEVFRLECGTAYEFHTAFAAGAGGGSAAFSNIWLGNIGRAKFLGGETSAAGLHGMDIQGAKSVELHGFDAYFNSQHAGGVSSGINIGAVNRFLMTGGLSGANKAKLGDTGYTAETQAYGINNANTVSGARVSAYGVDLSGNVTGPINGSVVNTGDCIGVPWTSVAITPVAQTGTLTTASGTFRYEKAGATLRFSAQINIPTNGSGAGSVNFTLPLGLLAASAASGGGEDAGVSGNSLQWFIGAGSGLVMISAYNHTYPASSGSILLISGTIEVTA